MVKSVLCVILNQSSFERYERERESFPFGKLQYSLVGAAQSRENFSLIAHNGKKYGKERKRFNRKQNNRIPFVRMKGGWEVKMATDFCRAMKLETV